MSFSIGPAGGPRRRHLAGGSLHARAGAAASANRGGEKRPGAHGLRPVPPPPGARIARLSRKRRGRDPWRSASHPDRDPPRSADAPQAGQEGGGRPALLEEPVGKWVSGRDRLSRCRRQEAGRPRRCSRRQGTGMSRPSKSGGFRPVPGGAFPCRNAVLGRGCVGMPRCRPGGVVRLGARVARKGRLSASEVRFQARAAGHVGKGSGVRGGGFRGFPGRGKRASRLDRDLGGPRRLRDGLLKRPVSGDGGRACGIAREARRTRPPSGACLPGSAGPARAPSRAAPPCHLPDVPGTPTLPSSPSRASSRRETPPASLPVPAVSQRPAPTFLAGRCPGQSLSPPLLTVNGWTC
jgi:hypothetical protein